MLILNAFLRPIAESESAFCNGLFTTTKVLGIAGGAVVLADGYNLFSDKSNYTRSDSEEPGYTNVNLIAVEPNVLFLASLSPTGHINQPSFTKHLEPYHWIVSNDKTHWLFGVDPTQCKAILSIEAFMKAIKYSASGLDDIRGHLYNWTSYPVSIVESTWVDRNRSCFLND